MTNFDQRNAHVENQFNAEQIFFHSPASVRSIDSATLEAAQRKFAELPLETIPDVTSLPYGSSMPFSRNPLFVGHEDDLFLLAKMLKGGEVAVIGQVDIAAATGMGGIGKTQLASEFVHRYGQFFPGGVIWLNFADKTNIETEIAKCCDFKCLGIQIANDNFSLEEKVQLVLTSWSSPIPRLLIFDNCEDELLLDQWRPKTGGCRILITSLRPNWDMELGVKVLRLDVLSRQESVELLCKFRTDFSQDDAVLGEISEELGYLPLALHLAGSFLKRYPHSSFGTPEAYLTRLRQTSPLAESSLHIEGITISTHHTKSLKQTFDISFGQLEANDKVDDFALKLLARTVYFAADVPTPQVLLWLSLIQDKNDVSSMELLREDAIDRLVILGLLERLEDGTLHLHRLVKEFVRIRMEDEREEAQRAVENALLKYAIYLNENGLYSDLLALEPHLRNIIKLCDQRHDINAVKLQSALGLSLLKEGRYTEAQSCFEKSYELYKQILTPDTEELISILSSLATIYYLQGDYIQSERFARETLVICEQTLTPEHILFSDALNNLGRSLYYQGKYLEAEKYIKRSLRIRKKSYGRDNHPDIAYNYTYLAMICIEKEQFTKAISYFEKALNIRKSIFGENHPDVAECIHELAGIYRKLGNFPKAKVFYDRALETRKQSLGANHPDVAESLNSLGVYYLQQNEFAKAEVLFEQAIENLKAILKPDHHFITKIQANLVDCLMKQGKEEAAEKVAELIIETQEQVLGPENKELAINLQLLANVYVSRRSYRKAERVLKQALQIYKHTDSLNGEKYIRCMMQYRAVLQETT